MDNQKEIFAENAERLIKALKDFGGSSTAWELKLKLHLSSSALFLALGRLEALNKVNVFPEDINFRITLVSDKIS